MNGFPDETQNVLHVFYDGECGVCRRCRDWFEKQQARVTLRFVPLQTAGVCVRFPELRGRDLRARLIAVDDRGVVFEGAQAWIQCLDALPQHRAWARRLSHPALTPLAGRICELISKNRHGLSRWLLGATPDEIREAVARKSDACGTKGVCNV